jgi:lysophospholipase L1-like esterase
MFGAKRKVHTIGDSTMSEYKPMATPKRGWGMYLQAFCNADSLEVNNRGKSGASTRTFYETENLWPSVKKQMKAGDYLIIQFAHNDEKCKGEDVYAQNAKLRAEGKDTLTDMRGTEPNTTYKAYLRKFIKEAREMGVKPILMSPICRVYFKDGKINEEGRHDLTAISHQPSAINKDYVRCMREVAQEMHVPFLDMTESSREMFEEMGQTYCMERYFNCGDKTHTGQEGGMVVANMAYRLIATCPELKELHHLVALPPMEQYVAYVRNIEDSGKRAAYEAKGEEFLLTISDYRLENIELTKDGFVPTGGAWPAGEIDEVANRYIEYTISAEKKKAVVVETMRIEVCGKGGDGMNIHMNFGFGDTFRDVTTFYENTALPKDETMEIVLDQPILIPAGETLHVRVLPWYDSNGHPQRGKYIHVGNLRVTGKRLY